MVVHKMLQKWKDQHIEKTVGNMLWVYFRIYRCHDIRCA